MIEQIVYCDKCGAECSNNYFIISLFNHTEEGSYTTENNLDLCPNCFSIIDKYLNVEFSVRIEDDYVY